MPKLFSPSRQRLPCCPVLCLVDILRKSVYNEKLGCLLCEGGAEMKVLIVDDEPSIVNLIRMNLKLEG